MPGGAYSRYRLAVFVLASCGLRWSHLAALRTDAVDLMRQWIDVREAVSEVNGARFVWGTPKSHGRRSVPLPRFLVIELAVVLADRGGGLAWDSSGFTSDPRHQQQRGLRLRSRKPRAAFERYREDEGVAADLAPVSSMVATDAHHHALSTPGRRPHPARPERDGTSPPTAGTCIAPTGRRIRTPELVTYRIAEGKVDRCCGYLFPGVRDARTGLRPRTT